MSSLEPIRSGLRLRVLEGDFHCEIHRLERALISIGRSTPDTPASANYLTFPEPTVSRLHAVLTWENGAKAYLLHHRSQTNPTILNNAIISGPTLLKAGDRITLGRLVLLVEVETETEPAVAPASHTPTYSGVSLNAQAPESDRVFSAPVRESIVVLTLSNDRSTAAVAPIDNRQGRQEVRLPGSSSSQLRFDIGSQPGQYTVETASGEQPRSLRHSYGARGVQLLLPVRAAESLPMSAHDTLLHQEFRIWLGDPDAPPCAPSGSDPAAARLQLEFLNGEWLGAILSCPLESANLRLAPGEVGLPYPLPLPRGLHAELASQDGKARLRAVEVSDELSIEVDGEVLFTGDAVPLVGGSRVVLGSTELVFHDGSEALYRSYRLVDSDNENVYPIAKASVRLGTAAHCEIALAHRDLPPIIGRISFENGSPKYLHTDLSASVRIDGEELSAGLSAPLHLGSQIELKPSLKLRLEQTSNPC